MAYVAGSELGPGTRVSGYRIETLIGRGGMGAVYRASEEGLGRNVALKVIAPELAQDERFRERFLRESRIAASLDHPHVIPIYGAGEEQGLLYLAMRYVEGTDLAKLVAQEGALEPRRALELLSQVAEALDAAHEKGLIHRDVKPSNVLIAEAAGREHCYLGDFGLTKRTGSLSGVSVAGTIVGTLEYVPPEQITGEPLDERSDVYSLGCVLYECLTGQAPFPRATDVALLWAHVHEEPTPPSKARPELPRELDTVLARGLAKEPGRRYRSAGELIAATRSALRIVDAPPPDRRRSRLLLALPLALVLLVAAAVAVFALTRADGGLSSVSPNSVGVIDAASNRLVAEVPVGIDPEAIAVGEGAVWATNVEDETISRIDPADTVATPRTISVGDYPSDVTAGSGSVWVALGALAELVRVNPDQNTAASPIAALGEGVPCGGPRANLTLGGGFLWFVCEVPELGRIDPRTNQAARIGLEAGLLTSPSALLREFADVAFGLGSLWIVDRSHFSVIELDPATNQSQRTITVGQRPSAIAIDESTSTLWVANEEDDTVERIVIAERGQAPVSTTHPVGDGPVDVAVGEDAVWVANQLERTVMRLDPETGDVVETIAVGNEPQRLAAGEGRVWVTVRAAPTEDG
ncbi:MAG TPA: serine/threonine-protein kinase [Gaiellaceae bacterium]|nr:serine/threonine-protein kinase [Gaiellaceae bacterium]